MSWDGASDQILRELVNSNKKAAEAQEKTAEAFTRVASALESLAGEIKALREEQNPRLDKPQKLSSAPAATP